MKTRWTMVGLAIVLAGYALGASALEPSAVLQRVEGRVFVGQAAAMPPAQGGMPLYAGNRVVVAPGGGATVAYAGGCSVALAENSLLVIGGPDQCETGQAVAHTTGGFQNTPIGQAGPTRYRSPVATVGRIEGTGLVNRSRAAQGMSLFRNYKVKAGLKSQIVVKYSNGCEAVVEAGKTLVIGSAPDCQPGRMGEESVTTAATQGAAAGGAAAGGAAAGGAAVATGGVSILPAAVVGGLAILGPVASALANDDKEPSCPSPPCTPSP